jgi:predicted N-formylglutamate amidohydrolase
MKWQGPFEVVNGEGSAPIVIVCDHASNALPPGLDLGVGEADMQRHIAWDIGAARIALWLAARFDAPAVISGASRLLIDCNRRLQDPTLIPSKSDGTVVPANLDLKPAERERRIAAYFEPYHAACRDVVQTRYGSGRKPLFVSIHTMTDRMNGAFRPWEIALSSNENRRATDPALVSLRKANSVAIGDNEPYDMSPNEDYSTPEHALSRGLDYLQVEFRQDIVATKAGQERLAAIFAEAITAAVKACKPT